MVIHDSRFKKFEPHGNTVIWRYMTFQKFMDLIINSRLFFTNLNKLSDKYEGTVYDSNIQLAKRGIEKEDQIFQIDYEKHQVESLKHLTLVNCWTMQRHESYALWKIYNGNEPGVAIRTTVANLKKAINSTDQLFNEDIFMAKVKYQNTLDDTFSRIEASITKREFYDFECEMRLLIFNYALSEGGHQVPYDISIGRSINVNLKILIGSIYISPFMNLNYHKNIMELISKFQPALNSSVRNSQIQDR
jgi:hypothetical protein